MTDPSHHLRGNGTHYIMYAQVNCIGLWDEAGVGRLSEFGAVDVYLLMTNDTQDRIYDTLFDSNFFDAQMRAHSKQQNKKGMNKHS